VNNGSAGCFTIDLRGLSSGARPLPLRGWQAHVACGDPTGRSTYRQCRLALLYSFDTVTRAPSACTVRDAVPAVVNSGLHMNSTAYEDLRNYSKAHPGLATATDSVRHHCRYGSDANRGYVVLNIGYVNRSEFLKGARPAATSTPGGDTCTHNPRLYSLASQAKHRSSQTEPAPTCRWFCSRRRASASNGFFDWQRKKGNPYNMYQTLDALERLPHVRQDMLHLDYNRSFLGSSIGTRAQFGSGAIAGAADKRSCEIPLWCRNPFLHGTGKRYSPPTAGLALPRFPGGLGQLRHDPRPCLAAWTGSR